MAEPLKKPEPTLYDRDFHAWTQEQGAKLRGRAHNDIDWDNAAEEIESLGRSEKRSIRSRMGILVKHLLKWQFQPERRSHSWQTTISEQRLHIEAAVDDSPSLASFPEETLGWAYQWAKRDAPRETGLPLGIFPERCPYSIEEILDHGFLPGEPWSPEALVRD